MCGIAGYFGLNMPSEENIRKCSESIYHRGPDGHGYFKDKNNSGNSVVLIHRRLAIIDLDERSNQPFKVGENLLIFNGEIYNYIEIREELIKLGHNFYTSSDTEVLAKSLIQWGTDALKRLEGMWAFAWYNKVTGDLILSRDKFGEKPLYLWQDSNGFYFGSEIKALASLAGYWPTINKNHLLRYLINGYKSLYKVSETFYEGVNELQSGHFLAIDSYSNFKIKNYWEKRQFIDTNLTSNDAIEKTRECLINSVKLRLRSDVPLAFCMSGGIDSNSLIAIAKKHLGSDVHGFTVDNKDKRYEEKDLVDKSKKDLQIKHTYTNLNKKDFLKNLRRLIIAHDSPVYTITYFVHWQLMEKISEAGFKVSISGTGADELFTGYYDHHNFYLAEIQKNKDLYSKSFEAWQKYINPIVRNPFLKNPNIFIEEPTFRDHIFLNNDVFSEYCYSKWHENFIEKDFGAPILRNRMLNELFMEAVPVILHEDDLNAMHFSIENRSPFLDTNLYELAYSIPTSHLIKQGRTKSILREAMRGLVSDEILNSRRKVGFNAPIEDLIDFEDPNVKDIILDESPIFELVCKEKIERLLNNSKFTNSASKFLFSFINAKIFLELNRK